MTDTGGRKKAHNRVITGVYNMYASKYDVCFDKLNIFRGTHLGLRLGVRLGISTSRKKVSERLAVLSIEKGLGAYRRSKRAHKIMKTWEYNRGTC